MTIKEKLESNLHEAMKKGNVPEKNTIRLVLSAVKLAEVEKGTKLDDTTVISIIQKEIKSRQEMIAEAQKGNREDIIKSSKEEITILENYLPTQLTDDEIFNLVRLTIDETQANTVSDMGKVMKVLMPKIQGRAQNDKISSAVKQLLSNK